MGFFGGDPNKFKNVFYKGGDMRFLAKTGILSPLGVMGRLIIQKDLLAFNTNKFAIKMPFKKIDFAKVEHKISLRGSEQEAIAYAGAGMPWGSLGAMAKDLFVKIPFVDENGKKEEPVFEFTNKGEAGRFQKWLYEKVPKSEESDNSENPLKTLKLRYAKGEITKKEFEDMKKTLDE